MFHSIGNLAEVQQLDYKEEILRTAPELDDDSTVHRWVAYNYTSDILNFVTSIAYINAGWQELATINSWLHQQQLIIIFRTCRVRSSTINGTTYIRGQVVIYHVEDDTPIFGTIIEFIVIPHLECLFIISPLTTVCFNHHFHAHEVYHSNQTLIYRYKQLHDYHPLVCTKPFGDRMFVTLKYHVF